MRTTSRQVNRGLLTAACTIAVALPVGGWVAGSAAFGQDAAAPATSDIDAKLVSLDVRDAPLEQAVQFLTNSAGIKNIVIQKDATKPFGKVTLNLTDQPVDKALRLVAMAAGASLVQEDGIYFLKPQSDEKPVTPEPVTPGVTPVELLQPSAANFAPKRGPAQTIRIALQFLKPSICRRLFTEDKLALEIREHIFKDPVEEMTRQISSGGQARINYVPLPGTNPVPENPQGAGGGGAGRDTANFESAGQRGGGFRGGGGGGLQGGGFPGGGGGFQGGGFQGGGQQGGIGGQQGGAGQQQGQQLLPEGIDNIIAYDADNVLIVKGDADAIEELRGLIRFLDVKPKQVQIKAEFVAVSVNDADSFGIDWRFQPAGNLDIAIPSVGGSAPTIVLAYASGNAVASARATLTRRTSNLLQSPIISTTNNTLASINFASGTTIFQSVQTVTNVGIITQTNQQVVQANNGLQVVPHINGDNSVTLSVTPTLSDFTPVAGPNGATGIDFRTQTLTTTRTIRNNETMVLGGFITKTERKATTKVPLLGDLPIIGGLFRSRDRTVDGTETLVFLTPTIIEDSSTGTLGTAGAPAPSP